MLYKRQI